MRSLTKASLQVYQVKKFIINLLFRKFKLLQKLKFTRSHALPLLPSLLGKGLPLNAGTTVWPYLLPHI